MSIRTVEDITSVDVHSMEIHSQITTSDINILRVPSGWIYTHFFANQPFSVFVPYTGYTNYTGEQLK